MKSSKFMKVVKFLAAPIFLPTLLIVLTALVNNTSMGDITAKRDLKIETGNKSEGLALKEIKDNSTVFTLDGKKFEVETNESYKLPDRSFALVNSKWNFKVEDVREDSVTIKVFIKSQFKMLIIAAIASIVFIMGILFQLLLVKRKEVSFK